MDMGVSAVELVALSERASGPLGWSDKYISLLATAIGAAFKAEGLSENDGRIRVDAASAKAIADRLVERSAEANTSERTARTYAGAWRRVAAVADAWNQAGSSGELDTFWDTMAERFRDRRVRRRSTTRLGPSHDYRYSPDPDDLPGDVGFATVVLGITTSFGEFELALPRDLAPSDALAFIETIARHATKNAPPRSSQSS